MVEQVLNDVVGHGEVNANGTDVVRCINQTMTEATEIEKMITVLMN